MKEETIDFMLRESLHMNFITDGKKYYIQMKVHLKASCSMQN